MATLRLWCSRRGACLAAIVALFVLSRVLYYLAGVRFDSEPLQFYWQILDPVLLRDAFWQSLLYLRDQPPAFNFFLGAVIHLFPYHQAAAFHASYLCMGLAFVICLFLLLDGMRVNRYVSLAITVVFIASPVTVLYENLLFYEYPVAFFFCAAALFLRRYASRRHILDGVVFFTALALISATRAIFHAVWVWLVVAWLLYALPRSRRRTLWCAFVPCILVSMIYVKTFLLFGIWTPGADTFGGANVAGLAAASLPDDTLRKLAANGIISPAMLDFFCDCGPENTGLLKVVAAPPPTGIRALDQRLKSTGYINMNSQWMGMVGRRLHDDGLIVVRRYPTAYVRTVLVNMKRYFLPADTGWPFDGRVQQNGELMARWLGAFDLIVTGKFPASGYALLSLLTIPVSYWFGFRRLMRWAGRVIQTGRQTRRQGRRREGAERSNARELTLVFAFANVVYLTAVTVFYSYADQNRYAFEATSLLTLLFGLWVSFALRKIRHWTAGSGSAD